MLKYLFISAKILLFTLSVPCQDLPVIPLDNPGKLNGILKVGDIGTKFHYIPLETLPECQIGNVRHLEFDGEHVVVAEAERVLLFDKNGRFIHQLGAAGKGPGEYDRISDIALNPITGILAVLPNTQQQILFYDLGNHHLSTVEVNPRPDGITWTSDGYLIGAFNDRIMASARNLQTMVAIYDEKAKILKKFPSYLPHQKTGSGLIMLPPECLHSSGKQTWFKWTRNDTLFAIEKQLLTPKAVFDFHEVQMPFGEFTVERFMNMAFGGDYLQFMDVIIDQSRLYFQYKWNHKEYNGVYYPDISKLFLIGQSSIPEKISDNLDNGPGFWPREIFNGHLIDWFFPSDVKDLKKWSEKTGIFLKEDDNQVVRILTK